MRGRDYRRALANDRAVQLAHQACVEGRDPVDVEEDNPAAEGVLYLFHFSKPLAHARHYLGWTSDLDARLAKHLAGRGAKITRAAVAAGVDLVLAGTRPGTKADEGRYKDRGGLARVCPLCRADKKGPFAP